MTVLLVLLTLLLFIGADAIKQHYITQKHPRIIPDDAFRHVLTNGKVVYTMADGGKRVHTCSKCGQRIQAPQSA